MARSPIAFVMQFVVLGLAVAFIVVALRPDLLGGTPVVSVTQRASTPPDANRGPVSYAAAVNVAAPAVVNIHVMRRRAPSPDSDPFIERFTPGLEARGDVGENLGSGVLISPEGYILTSNHVVEQAEEIEVMLRDGRSVTARLIGEDPETDIAVLKVDLPDLPAIAIAESIPLRVGDVVLAIGNPFGVGQTVTMGIVSATGRDRLGINTFEDFIQTDAAINPGNSGGALINAHGDLVGINSAIFSQSGGSEGIGFAIPVALAQGILRQLLEKGYVERGWLGIEVRPLEPAVAKRLDIEPTVGVLISGVARPGPGVVAGLRAGDVLTHIDDVPVTDPHEAVVTISKALPGERVALTIRRDGKLLYPVATVIQRPTGSIR